MPSRLATSGSRRFQMAFLLEMGERLVLVDTGAGDLFGPSFGGKLLDSLHISCLVKAAVPQVPMFSAT